MVNNNRLIMVTAMGCGAFIMVAIPDPMRLFAMIALCVVMLLYGAYSGVTSAIDEEFAADNLDLSIDRLPKVPMSRVFKLPYRSGGYIYLIRDRDITGYVKIGRTTNPASRLTSFGAKLPFAFDVLCVAPVDNDHDTERMLHNYYKPFRVSGEWFKLTPIQIDALVTYLDNLTQGGE